MEQKEGGSRALWWERQTIKKWWTHIAKVYGMIHSPWVLEPELNQATCYKAGQAGPRNQLGQFLDECEIPDNQRKDPQFHANVSPSAKLSSTNCVYIGVDSSYLGFESSGVRLSLIWMELQWKSLALKTLRKVSFMTRVSSSHNILALLTCWMETNSSVLEISTYAVIRL